jgi:hypothetical protein
MLRSRLLLWYKQQAWKAVPSFLPKLCVCAEATENSGAGALLCLE